MSQAPELSYTPCTIETKDGIRSYMISQVAGRPLIGFAAWSNSGKTCLIEKIIKALKDQGIACAVIKHHIHLDPLDQAKKDSFRLAEAGAMSVTVSAPTSYAHFAYPQEETPLEKLALLADPRARIILVEGFKHHKISRFEFSRSAHNPEPVITQEEDLRSLVLGCISDNPQRKEELQRYQIPSFEIDDIQGITFYLSRLVAQFYLQYG